MRHPSLLAAQAPSDGGARYPCRCPRPRGRAHVVGRRGFAGGVRAVFPEEVTLELNLEGWTVPPWIHRKGFLA